MARAETSSDAQIHHLLTEYTDSLDALPHDLTKSFGDLRELDAVLRSSMQSITQKILRLVQLVKDPNVAPSDRLLLFLEIAEDAHRLKMGSEDKIRVAGRTCDDLASHNQYTKQILSMLAALDPAYDSALYARRTTFPHVAPSNLVVPTGDSFIYGTGRRKRNPTNNNNGLNGLLTSNTRSIASGNVGINGAGLAAQRKRRGEEDEAANAAKKTPKGKEKEREKEQLRLQDKERHKNKKHKSSHNQRSPSPLDDRDSHASRHHSHLDGNANIDYQGHPRNQAASTSNGALYRDDANPYQPNMGRDREQSQMSAHLNPHHYSIAQAPLPHSSASNGGKRPTKPTGTSSLLDVVASRTHPNPTPNSMSSSSGGHGGSPLFDDDDYELMDTASGPMHRNESTKSRKDDDHERTNGVGQHVAGTDDEYTIIRGNLSMDGPDSHITIIGDADETRYCYCDQVSFGEMIGCDDEDCEREWFHLSCLGMQAPPKGEWFCAECSTKRAAAGGKKSNRSGRANNGSASRGTTNSSSVGNGTASASSRARTTSARG